MKVAVTSGSGQLGSAIVKALIKEIGKENVIAIARTPERAKHLGVEVRKGDYDQAEDLDVALKGVDKILLVSGMAEPQRRVQQHRNVIETAKKNGIKKIVYTSIVGDEENTAFHHVVKSNRQTEEDVRNAGLDWVIGRNGIYIEPDLEYLDNYLKEGEIRNCAANGKCAYTSREELASAYTQMLLNDDHSKQIYNLVGEAISQARLTELINQVFGLDLKFKSISVEDYTKERQAELGNFIGPIIAGIYEGIKLGVNDVTSDFIKVTVRPHKSPLAMMTRFRQSQKSA